MSKSNRLTVKEYDDFAASVGYDKIKEILQSHTDVLNASGNEYRELGEAYNQFVYDIVDNNLHKSLTTIGLAASSVYFADDAEKAIVPIALNFIDTVFTRYRQFAKHHICSCYDKRQVWRAAFNAIAELETINWIEKINQLLEDSTIPNVVKNEILISIGDTMFTIMEYNEEWQEFFKNGNSNIPLVLLLTNHIGALHNAKYAHIGLMEHSDSMNVYLTQHPRSNTFHYATKVSLKGEGLLLAFGIYLEYREDILKYEAISKKWFIKSL